MSESRASQGRAKRIKLVGSDSVGSPPKEFSDDNDIAQMKYHIHNFANREEKRGECIYTGAINAHGHPWKLGIFPRGINDPATDAEYVTLGLKYVGENTKTDPVVAKAIILTKTDNTHLPIHEYSKDKGPFGINDFSKREDLIANDCNDAGTLTIKLKDEKNSSKYGHLGPFYLDIF